jgi:DinB superfamily
MTNTTELVVKQILDTWYSRVQAADSVFNKLTDEQLQLEVAPGRNRVIYILGHLVAVHDRMMQLLNLGEPMYPELDEIFLKNPDKSKPEMPTAAELKLYWKTVNSTLAGHFSNLKTEDWFLKHNSVSTEDFAKEPHRNRLNIIITRTNHMSYHLGQLALLK